MLAQRLAAPLFFSALILLCLQGCSGNSTANKHTPTTPTPNTPHQETSSNEYFVDDDGDDNNAGTSSAPFKTISKAAGIAQPGDTITVREGTYREWVKPAQGGTSEETRITYRAAEGEVVTLLGSEPVYGWEQESDHVWRAQLPEDFFGDFNPFNTLSRHPIYVAEDEEGDGWGWLKYGRWTHLGDIYLNGNGLTEKQHLEEVNSTPLSWYTETTNNQTTLWANFGEMNPNQNSIEVNARPYAFFPEKSGLGYITLEGFTILNVASHWAPPIHYQPAAVGPNGGHHWVIKNNTIMHAKAVCLSLGNPTGAADKTASGHHRITHNVILRCGQAGIAGAGWNKHSVISHNHIEDINYRREFGGWETAGIKHHVTSHLTISHNLIRNVHTQNPSIGAAHGIWNDYTNNNWRVSHNVIINTEGAAILAEANWEGPNLYDNNIVLDGTIGIYSSQGDAWVQNLFINTTFEQQNQDWGSRPPVGQQRWLNNMFFLGAPSQLSDTGRASFNTFIDHNHTPSPLLNSAQLISPQDLSFAAQSNESHIELTASYPAQGPVFAVAPLLNLQDTQLPFDISPNLQLDFFEEIRTESNNLAGALATLPANQQPLTVYTFSDRYLAAKALITPLR